MKTATYSLILVAAILALLYRINCPETKDGKDLTRMESFMCMLRDLNQPDDPPRPVPPTYVNIPLSAISVSGTATTSTTTTY